MATVLIASLGDSPVVVTAMLDLLQKEGKGIERLEVFYPNAEFAIVAYEDLICKSLQERCEVDEVKLYAEDISSEDAAYEFLHTLYQKLDKHQRNKDIVYLSLAGGRKSMAALMGLLAPLFTCVKELYHILDKDEGKKGHFLTTSQLYDLSDADQQRFLFPPHDRVHLLSIPYKREQQLSAEDMSRMFALTEEQLDEMWERDPEQASAVTYYTNGIQNGMLSVELTKEVAKQFRDMLRFDRFHAKKFSICFKQMHTKDYLKSHAHGTYTHKGLGFHFYKRKRTAERPVFHTEPIDIMAKPKADIKRVVVSALPIEIEERNPPYPHLDELVKDLRFPLETVKLEDIYVRKKEDIEEAKEHIEKAKENIEEAKEHILIIPLATSPMVATQLYQLYIDRGYEVHSVILVHTEHKDVLASVEIARDAFNAIDVKCDAIPLKGWNDIDTPEACSAYQELLEQTIQRAHDENESYQIDLTISGGRKGMAALATFAAQRKGIRRVVHTAIHERISDRVYEETEVRELQKLRNTRNMKKLHDRLFLRAYQDDKDAFALFTIPVIPVLERTAHDVTSNG